MPVFNFYNIFMFNGKQLFRVLAILTTTISLSLSSCSSEPVYNLEGEWMIFPQRAFINVIYNPDIAISESSLGQEAILDLITSSLDEVTEELKKLTRIVFSPSVSQSQGGTVEFYNLNDPIPILGTYTQEKAFFIIKNETFPDGIPGLFNNHELEIYYPRDYVQTLLLDRGMNLQTINSFVNELVGVGYYIRSSRN